MMPPEQWSPVPGFDGRVEVSDRNRVRTTASGSSGSAAASLVWLLLLLAAVVMVSNAHLVNTVANAVALALCSIPAGWLVAQVVGELRLGWECRRYAALDARRPRPAAPTPLAITARAPLAIEAAQPVPIVIQHLASNPQQKEI